MSSVVRNLVRTLPVIVILAASAAAQAQECSGPAISIVAPASVCRYEPARAVVVGAPDGATIQWTRSGTAASAISDDKRTLFFTSSDYGVSLRAVATTASGCSSASKTVAVLDTPLPPEIQLPEEPWCASQSRAATVSASPGESIEWAIVNGTIVGSTTSSTVTFTTGSTAPTILYATLTNGSSCRVTGQATYSVPRTITGDGEPVPPDAVGLSATRTAFPAAGGTATATIATVCAWTAETSAPWVTLTGASAGSGSATVPFSTAPNQSSHARSATLNVGGVELSITQEGTGVAEGKSHAVETVAGSPFPDFANGASEVARFAFATGIAVDAAGNTFVADRENRVIRKIDTNGHVTTFAGSVGIAGYADGPAASARFGAPGQMVMDGSGNLIVTDGSGDGRRPTVLRRITPAGSVSTLAGRFALAGYADGNGTDALFGGISALATGPEGDIYVADQYNYVLRRVTPTGVVSTIAGYPNASWPSHDGPIEEVTISNVTGIAVAPDGVIYLAAGGEIKKIENGTLTTIAGGYAFYLLDGSGEQAGLLEPRSITFSNGNLYLCDSRYVRRVTPTGTVTTLAGLGTDLTDGPGADVRFGNFVQGIAAAPDGSLVFTEETIRRIDPDSLDVTTVAGVRPPRADDSPRGSLVRLADGTSLVAQSERIRQVAPDGTITTFAGQAGVWTRTDGPLASATFMELRGITQCGDGTIYVIDFGSIRRISGGTVTTVAGSTRVLHGSHDGSGSQASFTNPLALTCHPSGDLYVSDASALRRVTAAGVVTTIAGSSWQRGYIDGEGATALFNSIDALAVGSDGRIYVADGSTAASHVIRRVALDGAVSTIAGVPGAPGTADGSVADARFSRIGGMTVTADGLYVTDGQAIRHLDRSGLTRTVAGIPEQSGIGDGTGSDVRLRQPLEIVKGDGADLYLIDDRTLRKARPASAAQLQPPSTMNAFASSNDHVNITWSPVADALAYDVFRSYGGGPFARVAETTSPTYTDLDVQPETTYLYRVRAVDAAGTSANSPTDLATTFSFTDDPVVARQTIVKGTHFRELHRAIEAVRVATNLAPLQPSPSTGTPVRSQYVLSLRSALNAARTAAGLTAFGYSTAATPGSLIRATDVNELRAATR